MTKDVILSISGLQLDENGEDTNVETFTAAKYYKKDNSHFLIYEEVMEGYDEPTRNMIRFREDSLEITKKGLINVHMIFEENRKNMSCYSTPYGDIMVGIEAEDIRIKEEEKRINVQVDYALEVNYAHLADCKINMTVCAKEDAGAMLRS